MPPDPLRRPPIVVRHIAGAPSSEQDPERNTVSSYCWVASLGEGVRISTLLRSRTSVTMHLQIAEESLQAIRHAIQGARLVSPLGARYSHETTSIFSESTPESPSSRFLESCAGVHSAGHQHPFPSRSLDSNAPSKLG